MREMHGSSSRVDRQEQEQQRQEREMAKADAHKQQQLQQQQQQQESGSAPVTAAALANQYQWKALKFGFSSKVGTFKYSSGSAAKKPKVTVASIFGNNSDEQ